MMSQGIRFVEILSSDDMTLSHIIRKLVVLIIFFNDFVRWSYSQEPKYFIGKYPTQLVIPTAKITAAFSNLGYLGIKYILEKAKLNYSQFIIVQYSDLVKKIEYIGISKYR